MTRPDYDDYDYDDVYIDALQEYADELEEQVKQAQGSRDAEAQTTINMLMTKTATLETELLRRTETAVAAEVRSESQTIIDNQAGLISSLTSQLADAQARLHAIGILTR